MDNQYKEMAETTELIRVIRPPKDSKEPFQVCNFFSILCTKGNQSDIDNLFQWRGTPKYVIGGWQVYNLLD